MLEISWIFQNYTTGSPTSVLYIKNLAKDVLNDDLYYIFGQFPRSNSAIMHIWKFISCCVDYLISFFTFSLLFVVIYYFHVLCY